MTSREIKSILLVHGIETEDLRNEVIPSGPRQAANREAGSLDTEADNAAESRFLTTRAKALENWLNQNHPKVPTLVSKLSRGWLIGAIFIGVAFLIGLLSNQLGEEKQINLLAFPLLGMLAWNLVVYLWEIIRWIYEMSRKSQSPRAARPVLDLLTKPAKVPEEDENALQKGLKRFASNWMKWNAPIQRYRLRSYLHVAAAVLAGTMVAGMYVKGLSNDYRAVWQSTFLNEHSLHAVLSTVLKPACWLTDHAIPSVETLSAMRETPTKSVEGGRADLWIHLYSATILMFVVAPRFLFAAGAWLASMVVARKSDFRAVDRPYFEKLLRLGRGSKLVVEVVPYSCEAHPNLRTEIRDFAQNQWGGGVLMKFVDMVPYGHEEVLPASLLERKSTLPGQLIILFNFASTPEFETNGALIQGIQQALGKRDAATEVTVLLDLTSFRKRLGGLAEFEAKVQERMEAWNNLVTQYAVEIGIIESEVTRNKHV